MTGSIYPSRQPSAWRVPGVYGATQPRLPTVLPLRTDVAGFIGFDPRVRDSVPPSEMTGSPQPTGHRFAVDVNALQVNVLDQRVSVPAAPRLMLSENPASIPIANGESIIYTIVVAVRLTTASLVVVAGTQAATGTEQAPSDSAIADAVVAFCKAAGDSTLVALSRPWVRLADVAVRRTGTQVALVVLPALRLTRCNDWGEYVAAFGTPRDDGTVLGRAVRAYFANGGNRCYISTVRRPSFDDPQGIAAAASEMVGLQGASEIDATGLERLMLVDEVSFIDAPDLHTRQVSATTRTIYFPATTAGPGFQPCRNPTSLSVVASGIVNLGAPLFPADLGSTDPWADPFLEVQLQMIARCIVQPWRMLLLLSPPLMPDGDLFLTPDAGAALAWRDVFHRELRSGLLGGSDPGRAAYWSACVALYYPWLVVQEVVGEPTYDLPPTPFAAGVIARRDLARGPAIAAANETLSTVVGVARPIDDAIDAALYSPLPDSDGMPVPAVNIIRSFAGYGIQVWGARTLSTDTWMRFLNVRRAVSAIERRCKAALDLLVFEPNTQFLWAQVTQAVLGVLMPMFESGGLRGSQPSEAFYVRCDTSVNTPDTMAAGQLICEVGVAVAAPAEFIVFRIGRQEGVVQVVE
jgi:hypothetical protein